MAVDHVAENRQGAHGIDQHAMAQHGLAHVGDQHVRDDAHAGHDRDVHLGMSEEPEQVLPEQSGAAGVRLQLVVEHQVRRDEEAGSSHVIEDEQNAGRHQNGECRQAHDEVMNQAQALSGRRHRLMPRVRMSSVVVMKLSEPSNWPMQKIPMRCGPEDYARAFARTANRADGTQAERIASSRPASVHHRRRTTTSERGMPTNVTQNDIMLKWGKGMSSAPT